jgi:protoporphyrinogen oxidase
VLGGGWSGILSAFELRNKYPSASITILESSESNELGGLLKSVNINGFTYDCGGPHILFSKHKEILDKIVNFLGDNVRRVERKAYIYYKDQKIPYPFENGMYMLKPEIRAELGKDLLLAMIEIAKKGEWVPETFKDWIYGFFGKSMGSTYLEPYNKKIWKMDPENMDASWVFTPGRLPFPSLDDITLSIAGCESIGYKEQQYFYYPKEGGIQSLYNSLLKKLEALDINFMCGYRVDHISREQKGWKINDELISENVVNTLPLRILPQIFKMPEEIVKCCHDLIYNRDVVIGIAIDKPGPIEHVLYVPSQKVNFHRMTWMSNLVQETPKNKSNLIAEITVPYDIPLDIIQITDLAFEGMLELGVINGRDEILFTKTWVNEFGYPVYDLNHQTNRSKIMKYLNDLGIQTVGRWGSWHYWNTDMVYKAVLEMVDNFTLKKYNGE